MWHSLPLSALLSFEMVPPLRECPCGCASACGGRGVGCCRRRWASRWPTCSPSTRSRCSSCSSRGLACCWCKEKAWQACAQAKGRGQRRPGMRARHPFRPLLTPLGWLPTAPPRRMQHHPAGRGQGTHPLGVVWEGKRRGGGCLPGAPAAGGQHTDTAQRRAPAGAELDRRVSPGTGRAAGATRRCEHSAPLGLPQCVEGTAPAGSWLQG